MTRTIAASDLSGRTGSPPGETGWPVRLRGVTVGHAGHPDLLRGIDLTVTAGSFNFLTGASGSGKSVLLGLIAGLGEPARGDVALWGQGWDRVSVREARALRRRIGLIAQDDPLIGHLSVLDTLAVTLRVTGEDPRGREDNLQEMLAFAGLSEVAGRPAHTLSRGEQRRAALARAMMTGPELILADEPLTGLDTASAKRLMGLFRTLNRQGATVILTQESGQPGLKPHTGDRVLVLADGQVRDLGQRR